ncbi:trypsin Tyr p 3.0101-like [Sitodiplosis mosellana]|uniref:trypsin Tyr p 3.0101-like n=1 Tax=Sitodiplosis mosellana TaxID=263140 RepID=UPI002443C560|nr:trypsin Tyr p 3.0101-like [Sitodiplosis mosellana]
MNIYLFIVLYHTVCVAVDRENGTNIRISLRIDATDDQFPFQVSLQSYDRHICSGAIVNNRFILTSASCVHAQSAKWIYAVLGRLRLNQRIDIKYISEHESFSVVSLKNNLALLRTVQEINFSHWIQPVRLLSSNLTDNENHELQLSGWNELRVRDGLQYQNVSFVQCKAEDTHLDISDGVVCAENYESLSDFRPDKGSLLSVKSSDGRNYLVGILSRYHTWVNTQISASIFIIFHSDHGLVHHRGFFISEYR